ncbi:hypothetical protein GCM10022262_42950 [Georgenia daeguensis]|uniref:Uncharacterized protein n=1 Tax=Georgenia daeguensis TaxID=908355 RepID=A0ABP6UPS0_9MICO
MRPTGCRASIVEDVQRSGAKLRHTVQKLPYGPEYGAQSRLIRCGHKRLFAVDGVAVVGASVAG